MHANNLSIFKESGVLWTAFSSCSEAMPFHYRKRLLKGSDQHLLLGFSSYQQYPEKKLEFVLLIQQHHYDWTAGNNASSSYVNSVNKTSDKHFTALNSSFFSLRTFQSLVCSLISFIRAWVGQVKTNMTPHKEKRPSHEKSHSAYLLYMKTAPIIPSLRQQELFHVSLTTVTLQHFPGRKPCSQDDPGCMVIKAEMELMKQNGQTSNFNVFSCNIVTSCKVWCCLASLFNSYWSHWNSSEYKTLGPALEKSWVQD